jgi:alpha-tubulin suppressor-like RCC1 family protein
MQRQTAIMGGAQASAAGNRRRAVVAAAAALAALAASLALASSSGATPAGQVVAAGDNYYGQFGTAEANEYTTSLETAPLWGLVTQLSDSFYSAYAVLANGTVEDAGYNGESALGAGLPSIGRYTPVVVPGLSGVSAVSGGYDHFGLALLSNGTVDGWGYGYYGELGNGKEEAAAEEKSPTPIPGLEHVSQIAAGCYYSLALLSNGTVEAWGSNQYGELGDGTTEQRNAPQAVPGISNAVAIATDCYTSYALLSNGKVMAWGYGAKDELGNGTKTANQTTPVEVKGLSEVKAIAAGYESGYALLSNGTVEAWGLNEQAEVGDGTTTERSEPVPVPGLSGVAGIAATAYDAYALFANGTVEGWGYGYHGELLNGKKEKAAVEKSPTPMPGLTGVLSIGGGGFPESLMAIEGAAATVSTSSVTFPAQAVGTHSAAQTVTLTNNGPAPLAISGDVLTGSAALARSSDTCAGATIAAGGTCAVSLTFSPTATGGVEAALAFSTSASNALPTVAIKGTGAPAAETAPVLGSLSLSASAFRAAKSGPSVTAASAVGTVLSYTDSQAATATFTVQQVRKGIVRGKGRSRRCVAAPRHMSKRARRKARHCTSYKALGSFTHADAAGTNRFRFTGRVRGRALKPGRYRLVAVARSAGGSSKPQNAGFKIVKH